MSEGSSESAGLRYALEPSGIATITFDRPERLNALDWPAMEAFAAAVEDLHARCRRGADEVASRPRSSGASGETAAAAPAGYLGGPPPPPGPRVLILCGAGERAFCSGGDQHALHTSLEAAHGARLAAIMGDALARLEALLIPSIAAVNGFALGGGSEIALACDLRVVSEDVKFGLVHLKLGLVPGWGAGQRLLRLVGHARAARMLLEARPFGASELLDLGLVSHVTPPRAALPAARALAEDIAAADPATVRAIKALLAAGRELPYAEALAAERALFPELWAAPAHLRAVERFMAGGKNA